MLTKGRILIVDDEEIIRDVLAEMLTVAKYRVGYANNGNEGVVCYKFAIEDGDSYDVVLMDMDMPGNISGLDATREILSMDPAARVVLSSGNYRGDLHVNYRRYGFSGRLSKPYGMSELIEVIGSLLVDKVA